MKAVVIREHGGPECVRVEEVPTPQAPAGEVVLAVRAAALNHLDIWVRKGRRGAGIPMPHILGSDASGVIVSLGEGVQGVNVGDEVMLNPGISCGKCEFCLRGEQSECPSFGVVGMARPGTFAERVAVPAESVYPKPAHLTFEEAAALPLAHLTAWHMLMSRAKLRPGELVLIHGIGGGVALAGLQLAKLAGAQAIVTSSSDAKLEKAQTLGADKTINYRSVPDVAREVRNYTGGRGADIALDTVGAATWPINLAALRRGGRVVLCGVSGGATLEVNLQPLYWNHFSILGSTMGSHEDFRLLLNTVTSARLRPVVDSVFPLEQAAEAMARMEAGEQFGKIILNVS